MPSPTPRPRSAPVIAELAREAQLAQLSAIDSLDTKAATVMGFAGVILGLLFTSDTARANWNDTFAASVGLLAASIVVLGLALLPRHYKFNPNIAALERAYLTAAPEVTQAVVVESIVRALISNSDKLRGKVWLVRIGSTLVVAGLVTASVRLLYSLS